MAKDSEFREHAENLARYFEQRTQESDFEVWLKGKNTVLEWLRLIDSDDCSQKELASFMGIIHANRHRSSGWYDLALRSYSWIASTGYEVPSPEEFFAPSRLPNSQDIRESPWSDQAHALLRTFQQYDHEDPTSEVWKAGIKSTQVWLMLIEANKVKEPDVSALVEDVFEKQYKYHSAEWFSTALRISYWCKKIGYADLIPDNFRQLVDRDNY